MSVETELIRNFCIVAHIDHGKSTLADRILELTGAVDKREMQEQVLDSMELERERGITIKAKAVRIKYRAEDGKEYTLNLIDTPGHVDFSYEVSRSLAACEGAILLVDASQGVEAQTIANANLALRNALKIIPVINKIDLANAQIERTRSQLLQLLMDSEYHAPDAILLASAKTGQGTKEILEAIVRRVPPPKGLSSEPLSCLVFDSTFNTYEGVVVYVRVMNGEVKKGDRIRLMSSGKTYEVNRVGVFELRKMIETDSLGAGEVGYIIASIKDIRDVHIGDTITHEDRPTSSPLPGYRKIKPMVFASIYPVRPGDFEILKRSLEKLSLNDASLTYTIEDSPALGAGFRCGFLGLLHMDIVRERLEREYGLELILTMPSVRYRVATHRGETIEIDNPSRFPDRSSIVRIEEPYLKVMVITPVKYVSNIMDLVLKRKRGIFKNMKYMDEMNVYLDYEMPLAEMILEFYDQLKSASSGYASMDYEFIDYRPSDLVKLDVLVAGERIDALSFIVHRNDADYWGRELAKRLKALIPRHLFEVAIQVAIGGKIIARENIPALRKFVTGKCYGGDITRKRKLWEKQKEGKKRMKQIGRVEIPQEAFLSILKI